MVDTHELEARTRPSMGSRAAFAYALACYATFIAVFVYAVAFLADVIVPRTVDRGGSHAGAATAAVIDAALLAIFAIQHSVMARPAFKRHWTTIVPRHVERATYVLVSSAALALAFWQWRPIPAIVWDVSAPGVRVVIWTTYAAGWAWVLAMTFAIDHLDLLGLRQVARRLRGLGESEASFAAPWPYRIVRHPMMLGFIVAFLATPTMTVGHLLFAALGCGYILVGVRVEERDLATELPEYVAYSATTPRLMPRFGRRRS